MSFKDKVSQRSGDVNMVRVYYELADSLRNIYSSDKSKTSLMKAIPISAIEQGDYNLVNGGILEDYKSMLHYKLLSKVPGISNLSNCIEVQIQDLHEKHGLPEPSNEAIKRIENELDRIADKTYNQMKGKENRSYPGK